MARGPGRTNFRFEDNFDNFKKEVLREERKFAERAAMFAERQVKEALKGQRSGRTYTHFFYTDDSGRLRKFGSRPAHTASQPGEFPASDTSTLRNSITSKVVVDRARFRVTALVGYTVVYGTFLIKGTENMEPRKNFLWVPIKNNQRKIVQLLTGN